MPDYFYDMDLVVDPLNPSNVVAKGSVAIYDPADTAGTTLLALKDPSGLPLPNPLTSNANGFLPPRIATVPQTLWKSGGFEGYFNSFKGLRDEAVSAVAAAQGAADAATTAVAEVVTTAAVDGAGALVLTKANGSTVNAGNVRGPQGIQGAPGQNGSNVLPTDAAIKNAITTPGTETATALSATYATPASVTAQTANKAPVTAARPGNRFVAFGDSTTKGNTFARPFGVNSIGINDAWPLYAAVNSGQKLQYVANAGISGDTAAGMLARFDADVTVWNPNIVSLLVGRNDLNTDQTAWRTSVAAIIAKIRGIGATPIMCTILPTNTDATAKQKIHTMNKWIRTYAASQGIIVLDFYAQAIDPATGGFLASYGVTDGIHPAPAGYRLMGDYAATTLAQYLPNNIPVSPFTESDTDNLAQGALFLGAPEPIRQVPAPWNTAAAPAGSTFSTEVDSAVPGKVFRIDAAGTVAETSIRQDVLTLGANLAVGDKIAVSATLSTSLAVGQTAFARLVYDGATSYNATITITSNITRGKLYFEDTIPAGCTGGSIRLSLSAGTGWAKFGQIGVYNRTKLGIII